MPKTYTCPFFKWEKGLRIACEGGQRRFLCGEDKRSFVDRYCASVPGWRDCRLARRLEERYEKNGE